MTPFWEIPLMGKILFGFFSAVSSSLSIYVSIHACTGRRERRFVLSALLSAAVSCALFLGVSDVFTSAEARVYPSVLARAVGALPYVLILLLLLTCAGCGSVLLYTDHTARREKITPCAIKEAFDVLPDGICFAAQDGLPLLVNVRMNRLCARLTGESLTNAKRFWNDLYTEQFRPAAEYRSVSPSPVLAFPDGDVWDFQRHIVSVNGKKVYEILAFDVTAQYRLNRELKERNDRLAAVGERLRRFTGELDRLTREKEILSARIKVHDDVGRLLLALRAYLEKPESERDRRTLLPLWRYTVSVLSRKEEVTNPCDYGSILADAKAIGVTVSRSGNCGALPEDALTSSILLTALRECISNTVKHAHGNRLNFSLTRSGMLLTAEFTNNGEQPAGKISETGGLSSLRSTVEAASGTMMVASKPRFILRLELPAEQPADKEILYV